MKTLETPRLRVARAAQLWAVHRPVKKSHPEPWAVHRPESFIPLPAWCQLWLRMPFLFELSKPLALSKVTQISPLSPACVAAEQTLESVVYGFEPHTLNVFERLQYF